MFHLPIVVVILSPTPSPAPNAYDVRGNIPQLPEGAAPFDQSSKRFVYVYNENPGPGKKIVVLKKKFMALAYAT